MSTDSKLLSPDSSPEIVAKGVGVRRVNNLPIYIFGGIMLVFMLLMMFVAMDRASENNGSYNDGTDEVQSSDNFASMMTQDYQGGIIAPAMPPEMLELPSEYRVHDTPQNLDLPPLPPDATGINSGNTAEQDQIRLRKQQLFEDAVSAPTNVNVIAPRSSGSTPSVANAAPGSREETLMKLAAVRQEIDAQTSEDPTAAYQARMEHIKQGGGIGGGGSGAMDDSAPVLLNDSGAARDFTRFDSSTDEKRWTLDSEAKKPASPYILQAGFVIPATLLSGINSSLPGQIMAQVSQNIYDSPIGNWRLIPQGSRLVGTYSSEVEFGQARVLVAWQRIIFPDGKTMDIGAMPGADGLGQSGFNDQVNNHYMRIFGSALIMSAVIAGVAYSQRDSGGAFGRQNAGSIMSQSLGQQLGRVTASLVNKNINIAPTLEIRPGYLFNVVVTKDMLFSKPYQSFDY